jgi:hypothetical protein
MSEQRKPGERRRAARTHVLGAWAVIGLALVSGLAGCTSTPQTHAGDPLFGEYYPKGPNGQPMPPPNSGVNKTTSGVLPVPPASSATSTAAIANNTALPGGRALAINEKNGVDWTLTGNPNNNTTPAQPTANHPPIVQPVPQDPSYSAPINATSNQSTGNAVPAGTAPAPPMGMVTTDVLLATLQGKGAVGLKQEAVPDGVRVSCYVPQAGNPSNLRYMETVARDYPTGLQAILQQIDQQK